MGLFLRNNQDFISFWTANKFFCVFSHVKGSAERSFSVNKELLVEDISKASLTFSL